MKKDYPQACYCFYSPAKIMGVEERWFLWEADWSARGTKTYQVAVVHPETLCCTFRVAGRNLPPTPTGKGLLAGGTNLRASLFLVFPQAKKSRN